VVPASAGGVARAVVPARLRGARGGTDAVLGAFASAGDLAWCGRYIAQAQPDAVLVDTMFRAGVLALPELAGVNSVVIAHDVFHRRHRALVTAGYRVRPAALTREDEAGYLCRARHIAAIQPEEAALLAAMCPGANVFTAPMPALPCPRPAGLRVIPGRLVFVGSAALPNLDGLRWFFDEVWHLLAGRGISLDLAGDCGPALRQVPMGVTRLGRVKNLAPVLHRAALAIAPLRVGSGLKIKLLDYARHGLFTVATPASLAGFAADKAAPFLPAADAGAFARAILRGLAEPGPPAAALDYVAAHYGVAASFAGLAEALSA
jgi:succinoglycan biosynthesis protein ExoO